MKDCILTMPDKFAHLINLVIATSVYPSAWKKATVKPLPKGGDPSDVNNLRPISILPLPTKLMEKVIHKQLVGHLNQENILTGSQDGFRSQRSTLDSLSKFTPSEIQ